ncbi:MAG: serine hydrolase [Candidatus Eremiobacteraeota bacterium]|nr:serine hydrolase [Candidatus Eremiobacteraeota bacterium]
MRRRPNRIREFTDALDYGRKHGLHALLILHDGECVAEEYAGGWSAERAHALYSGTKSFWSIAAGAAAEDALLSLDEHVCETIRSWKEAGKNRVRIRDLLGLTSGLPFGGLGAGVPTYEAAIAKPLAQLPGTTFTYSGIPLQVFGAVLTEKLKTQNLTPLGYLKKRIFDPIGLHIESWRRLKDGTETLPTGAFLAAQEWAKFGQLLLKCGLWNGNRIIEESTITQCWQPGAINPRYGLGFWLYGKPSDADFCAYASGAGGQALYVVPAKQAVIVHFGQSNSYSHERFLRRLLSIRK